MIMRQRNLVYFPLLAAVVMACLVASGCDKEPEAPAPATNSATTADPSVAELLDKLPQGTVKGPKPIEEAPSVQVFGEFGKNGLIPEPDGPGRAVAVAPKAVGELNIVGKQRVQSAFLERETTAGESIIVQFGGADKNDGLLLTVRYGGRSVSRAIPPADSGPELVSNLDHTVDRLLDELGIPRRR